MCRWSFHPNVIDLLDVVVETNRLELFLVLNTASGLSSLMQRENPFLRWSQVRPFSSIRTYFYPKWIIHRTSNTQTSSMTIRGQSFILIWPCAHDLLWANDAGKSHRTCVIHNFTVKCGTRHLSSMPTLPNLTLFRSSEKLVALCFPELKGYCDSSEYGFAIDVCP
jgi:hypothetical protein